MSAFTDADSVFLFFLIVSSLGACFVWAFWEIEQSRERRRRQSRPAARNLHGRPRREELQAARLRPRREGPRTPGSVAALLSWWPGTKRGGPDI
jgi:hypothetical protein